MIVRFAHAKELASLTRFFKEELMEGVYLTLASLSPTLLTGGLERRFSPIEGLAGWQPYVLVPEAGEQM